MSDATSKGMYASAQRLHSAMLRRGPPSPPSVMIAKRSERTSASSTQCVENGRHELPRADAIHAGPGRAPE